ADMVSDMARRLRSEYLVGIGHTYQVILAYYMADWERGIEEGEHARRLLKHCGDAVELSFAVFLQALCHANRGELEQGLQVCDEGLDYMARID
ncbi:hypothetical protein, partial [Escherichia coli]|uniref:hypothetical protein n=1 Tax=Escherichia coli TaxID=562 RepID=UPI001411DA71